jgi:ribosomal protein S18 acetylase RimI-like enzyme
MYVAPEARGSGAADALLDALEADARVTGVTVCKLVCREDNAPARRLYERRGYEAYGREPDSIVVAGRGYVGLEMAKRLA